MVALLEGRVDNSQGSNPFIYLKSMTGRNVINDTYRSSFGIAPQKNCG